ncbi:MAG: PAS domain S-box protein, partial [Candidatus Heimdallarchaeota archaeon]
MTKQANNSPKKNKRKGTISLEEFVALEQELTKAKSECQESHNRFEALFEMTNDAIFLIDSETQKFILANKKAAELLGFEISDIVNYTAKDFIVTGEEENSDERIEQLLKDKVLPIYERTFVKKNGEQFIAEVSLSLIKDSSTGRTIIQSIVRDISERKRLENYLLRDREIYYRIANAAIKTTDIPGFCNSVLTDLTTYLDFDIGTLRVYNRKTDLLELLAVIGLPPKLFLELKPMKLSDKHYIISESLQKKIPIFAPNTDEEPGLTKYRERLKMFNIKSLISWPIFDKSDNIIGALQLSAREPKTIFEEDKLFFESVANMLANAIRRFFVEEDLQNAFNEQEELNKIINLSPAVVFLWKNEENWPVEFVSENVIQFGYSPEEFYNGKLLFSSIIHPDDLVKVIADTAQFSSETKTSKMYQQYRIITRTGEVRWINDYSRIRRDSNGNITHYNGILIDISTRKRAELALQNERKVYKIIADAAAISTNVPELSQYILDGLVDIFKFDVGSIRIHEPETKLLIPYAQVGFESAIGRKIKPISINEPNMVVSLVARTKQPLFAPDVAKSNLGENYLTKLAELEISALITWPILNIDNELLGVLQLGSKKPKDIPKIDEIVFETIAGTLANAIDRLLVQEAKQESDEKFRAFAEQTLTGVCLFNKDGTILFVNKHIEAITEYSSNETIGLDLFSSLEIIFPENNLTSENVQREILGLVISPTTFEFELRTKSGIKKWVSINITPTKIRDEIVYAA